MQFYRHLVSECVYMCGIFKNQSTTKVRVNLLNVVAHCKNVSIWVASPVHSCSEEWTIKTKNKKAKIMIIMHKLLRYEFYWSYALNTVVYGGDILIFHCFEALNDNLEA